MIEWLSRLAQVGLGWVFQALADYLLNGGRYAA
jgi:hypothetical protein